jgi:fibronectin type 3 domain-containing protein
VAQSNGLVAAYSFNEGTGAQVTDVSGNHLNGTIVGATWTTGGRYGNALSFNGTSSYIDLGNPAQLQLTGSMTLEAWVQATGNPPDDGQIIAKSDGTAGWQFKTSPDTGPVTFGVAVTGGTGLSTQRYSTTVRSLNTWYHIAGVYNAASGTLDIYVNGVLNSGTLRGASPIPNLQLDQAVNVNIGRRTGGYYFQGLIDEVRIYNRALSQVEIQTDMNTPIGSTPPPPDTIPPTVSMTAPLDGATVAGTLSVSATASDNVGVAGVQFLLDGANLGNQVTAPPYTVQWNSATTTNGVHTLAAVATDVSNNSTLSTSISVTVASPSPAQVGQWSAVNNWPIVAVHAALLPTGDVLAWSDYSSSDGAQLWRPSTNTFTPKPETVVDLFCAGHAYLADGRLLVVGGITGTTDDLGPFNGTIFDPTTGTWSQGSQMFAGRYYPTATTLPDGRVLVQGGTTTCGTCIADIPEIYDPVANRWTKLGTKARMAFKYYPHSFVLPDGRILVSSQDDQAISSQVLDLNTQTWTTVDARVFDGHSAAMYLPGKIIKAGTATVDNPGFPSAPTAYVLDMTQPSPAWQPTGSMAFPRSYLNLTILPDGQVLATGGSTVTDLANFSAAVYAAELWSPITQTWTTLSSAQVPREYHSNGLLLPDATVLVVGGGRQGITHGVVPPLPEAHDEPNSEIFSPPYLFKGPRPVISSAPSTIPYNAAFSVTTPDFARIASVSLIGLSAVTHAFNENQRFVPLTFSQTANGLSIQAPANGNIAPPGPYMLFLVDNNGVPSVAAMVRMAAPGVDTQPPTAPTNLTATPSTGAVSLTWTASTDNVGVTGYTVYRSTTSGFTPSLANQIGQISTTTYSDTSFSTAGTYYYLVTAQDLAGNTSSPSNQASVIAITDTTPPNVSVTSPASGATLSGVASVVASASDDVAVVGVQFLLDGANLGAEITSAGPTYTVNWTTTTATNGPHTLSARARDGAGNTSLAANVPVTVSNAAPTGLVAAYAFSEGSGTTVADSSGNNLTGTIVGATWTTGGRYGNALSFNGGSSYVDLGNPAALRLTGSMTLEAWINAAANPPDDGQIVAKSDGSGGWQFKTSPDTGPETFGVAITGSTGSNTQRYSTTVRALNTWYHVAGVYNAPAGTLDIYVNGVLNSGTLRGVSPVPTSQVDNAINANIGRRTGGFYFNGLIDEVRIYSRALSQAEIQTDMSTPIGTTPPPPDTTPPTAPSVLTATASSATQINLSWTASTDNVAVTGYLVERCQGAGCNTFTQITNQAGTSFNDTGLTASTSYSYRVRATDAAGNLSGYSNTATATTLTPDTTPPTAPSNLLATAASSTQINLTWTASTDNVGVTGYLVERCQGAGCINFAQIATPSAAAFNDTGLTVLTSYTYRVRATDAASNLSGYSATATATTPDTTPPTAPASLTASASSPSQINLSWSAATDNVGVAAYLIERCQGATCTNFAQVASVASGTTYSDLGLTATTTYRYRVRATDAANNLGGYSPTASATTPSVPDTQPPTAPSNLVATAASSTQINLTWTASTDNVGVTGYALERCQGAACTTFSQIATPTATTFSNTGLLANTSYSYRVRATDAAGNFSGYSNTASATTPGSSPPPSIAFVQVNSATPQSPVVTVTVPYSRAQTAGNLNVVVVGWNDSTATLASVTDSKGNSYSQAIAPTVVSGVLSQTIYYAKNIAAAAAGANTVTVKFNTAAVNPDIRVLEYAGIDTTSPLDAAGPGSGNSTTSSSASITTTNANDLLVGANIVFTGTSGAGAGFTRRIITVPDSDIVEDRVVSATGTYNATAPLTSSGPWIMQIVAFKAHP